MSLLTSGLGDFSLHQESLYPKKNGQDSTGISSPPESFWMPVTYSEGERIFPSSKALLTNIWYLKKTDMILHCCYSSQALQVCSHRGWREALVHSGRSTSVARGSQHHCACGGRQTCTPASRRGQHTTAVVLQGQRRERVFVGPGHSPAHVRTLVRH